MKLSGTLYVRDVSFNALHEYAPKKGTLPVQDADVLRGYLREIRENAA